jgi:hypothetical protein
MTLPIQPTASRPLFSRGINELEEYYANHSQSVNELKVLIDELGYRTTSRAQELLQLVNEQLLELAIDNHAAKLSKTDRWEPPETRLISAAPPSQATLTAHRNEEPQNSLKQDGARARQAHRYLKRGIFPPEDIEYFTVGRTDEIARICDLLIRVADGSQGHLFVEADYGGGKSHFLKATECIAMQEGFAVTWVTLDGYNHAFNHLGRYVHTLMENVRAPGCPVRGLAALCEYWLLHEQRDAIQKWANGSSTYPAFGVRGLSGGLADDPWKHFWYRNWIECRDIIQKSGRAHFREAFDRINALGSICQSVNLNGVVMLFDELESVCTLLPNIRSRMIAYEILDAFTSPTLFPNSLFVFAATPDFEAQLRRDLSMATSYVSQYPRGVEFLIRWFKAGVNKLQLPYLSASEDVELCLKMRASHATGYQWDPQSRISDEAIKTFVKSARSRGLEQRGMVRAFEHILELCEQYRSATLKDILYA